LSEKRVSSDSLLPEGKTEERILCAISRIERSSFASAIGGKRGIRALTKRSSACARKEERNQGRKQKEGFFSLYTLWRGRTVPRKDRRENYIGPRSRGARRTISRESRAFHVEKDGRKEMVDLDRAPREEKRKTASTRKNMRRTVICDLLFR